MRIPDSATKKYGPGDKVQEKQTVCCHLLDSFMFGCCSGYKVAMAMSFFFSMLAATLQIYLVFVKFKSVTER